MWVEIIDRATLADPDNVHTVAWRLYQGSGRDTDFSMIRVYNTNQDCTVTQHVYDSQLRVLSDKEVFLQMLKDKEIMDTILHSTKVVM